MPILAIPFPVVDPVLLSIGPLPIRWYALAYIFGLLAGWLVARKICAKPDLWGGRAHPASDQLEDLLLFAAFGAILGGRLFNVLFYGLSDYLAQPLEIFAVWKGGMAFHGGLIGVFLGAWLFARLRALPLLSVTDLCACVAPIGLFFGRLANFINGELWGRPSDVPWAVVFPRAGEAARHPSQIYEAGLEGALLLLILMWAVRAGALKQAGLASGVFGVGYGLARIFCEFFREPDPRLEALGAHLTMGMVLSAPLVVIGLWLIFRARKGAPCLP